MTTLAEQLKGMGAEKRVVRRGSILPTTEYSDGSADYLDMQSGIPGMLGSLLRGKGAIWDAGNKAAAGDWQGAGYSGGQAAGMAMSGGMGMARPTGSVGMAGNPIPISSWHGPRAAALRQRQMDEALALMRANPEKFMPGSRGAPLVDQLERAAQRYSFGDPVSPPPTAPGTVLPLRK